MLTAGRSTADFRPFSGFNIFLPKESVSCESSVTSQSCHHPKAAEKAAGTSSLNCLHYDLMDNLCSRVITQDFVWKQGDHRLVPSAPQLGCRPGAQIPLPPLPDLCNVAILMLLAFVEAITRTLGSRFWPHQSVLPSPCLEDCAVEYFVLVLQLTRRAKNSAEPPNQWLGYVRTRGSRRKHSSPYHRDCLKATLVSEGRKTPTIARISYVRR
jgi:hypothetical protein